MQPRGSAWEAAAVESTTMTERRYGEDEAREIFSLATTSGTSDQSLSAESGGLTLRVVDLSERAVKLLTSRIPEDL